MINPVLDIVIVSIVFFYYALYHEENELFIISLYEIGRVLKARREIDRAIRILLKNIKGDEDLRIPDEYIIFTDVFSKTALDILFSYRLIDHKIELE